MIDKLQDAIGKGTISHRDLEGAQKVFEFLAQALKETRVELEVQGAGLDTQLVELVKNGQMIPAIKRYRELIPGSGLKTAKDAIEQMAVDLGVRPWGHRP